MQIYTGLGRFCPMVAKYTQITSCGHFLQILFPHCLFSGEAASRPKFKRFLECTGPRNPFPCAVIPCWSLEREWKRAAGRRVTLIPDNTRRTVCDQCLGRWQRCCGACLVGELGVFSIHFRLLPSGGMIWRNRGLSAAHCTHADPPPEDQPAVFTFYTSLSFRVFELLPAVSSFTFLDVHCGVLEQKGVLRLVQGPPSGIRRGTI